MTTHTIVRKNVSFSPHCTSFYKIPHYSRYLVETRTGTSRMRPRVWNRCTATLHLVMITILKMSVFDPVPCTFYAESFSDGIRDTRRQL
jgi:hypothetical protein